MSGVPGSPLADRSVASVPGSRSSSRWRGARRGKAQPCGGIARRATKRAGPLGGSGAVSHAPPIGEYAVGLGGDTPLPHPGGGDTPQHTTRNKNVPGMSPVNYVERNWQRAGPLRGSGAVSHALAIGAYAAELSGDTSQRWGRQSAATGRRQPGALGDAGGSTRRPVERGRNRVERNRQRAGARARAERG